MGRPNSMGTYSKISIPSLLISITVLSACRAHCSFEEPIEVYGELSEVVDRSLLTQQPCSPPCWNGIIPGRTTNSEAVSILESLDFIDKESISQQEGSRGGVISWKTIFP